MPKIYKTKIKIFILKLVKKLYILYCKNSLTTPKFKSQRDIINQ